MPGIVRRSALKAVKVASRQGVPLPQFVPPQLSGLVEKPPSEPQWLHEIKLDGDRMAGRIDHGRARLLTRTGVDWTAKYPIAGAALSNIKVKTAYLDGSSAASTTLDCRASLIPRPPLRASAKCNSSIMSSIFCISTGTFRACR
jgi:ATP-dependent DNA ligase